MNDNSLTTAVNLVIVGMMIFSILFGLWVVNLKNKKQK